MSSASHSRLSLDVIEVNEPCSASWEQMAGDERVRFCAGCRKHVHNLSAVTRSEAERLVCETAGSLCVRFARGEDGVVQTLEYRTPAGRGRGWRFWTILSTCVAALVAGANGYLLAKGRPVPPASMVLGKRAAPAVMGAPIVMGAPMPLPPPPTPPAPTNPAPEPAAG
jgi:hypothetical protein